MTNLKNFIRTEMNFFTNFMTSNAPPTQAMKAQLERSTTDEQLQKSTETSCVPIEAASSPMEVRAPLTCT